MYTSGEYVPGLGHLGSQIRGQDGMMDAMGWSAAIHGGFCYNGVNGHGVGGCFRADMR